jgi:hypothetical protein
MPKIYRKFQCGFQKIKSITNHIFALRQLMEKYFEFDEDLYLLFIDFRQSYDNLNRN